MPTAWDEPRNLFDVIRPVIIKNQHYAASIVPKNMDFKTAIREIRAFL